MRPALALAAAAVVLLGACGDDEDGGDEPAAKRQSPPALVANTLGESMPRSAAQFELDEGSVQVSGTDVRATYSDPNGGTVKLHFDTLESPEEALELLDRVVSARQEQQDFRTEQEGESKSGGRLVVMSRSPGVQARPPDFAYLWTDGSVFAVLDGIGDAPGRLYEVLPTFTPAPSTLTGASAPVEAEGDDAFLEDLPPVERPSGARSARILGSAGKSIEEWLQFVADDVGAFWQDAMTQAGRQYVPATLSVFSAPITTPGCGQSDPNAGPRYCNHTMFFGLPWLEQNVGPIGDTAFAVIVAHETGHNLQDQAGMLDDDRFTNMRLELQADCFAGLWATSVYQEGQLERGDIEEAVTVLRAGGDLPGQSTNPHGTPGQRVAAFLRGFNEGRGNACLIEEFPGG